MLKRNILALALLLCYAAGFAQRTPLTADESGALKAEITAGTRGVQSLQSDFTQTKQLSYLENTIQSSGTLHFKAPGKIRWAYLSPTDYVVIFDGHTMHTVEGGRSKTVNLAANRRLSGLNDLLTGSVRGGNLLDDNRFDITYYREKTGYVAVLVPKETALRQYIQQVELTFDVASLLLSTVTLTDPAGDTTQLTFTNQRKNVSVSDTMFQP